MLLDDLDEEVLREHELELERLKQDYTEHGELYDAVSTWSSNWTLYQELEVRDHRKSSEKIPKPIKELSEIKSNYDCSSFSRKKPQTRLALTTEEETC